MSMACFSECGLYRYKLARVLKHTTLDRRPMLFIMLNPSTADAEMDDPTIGRCKSFALREGATHLIVVNLFAYKETNPKLVIKAKNMGQDIVGPDNNHWIMGAVKECNRMPIIAAWGASEFAEDRAREVTKKISSIRSLYCLGKTKSGAPRHPLYLKSSAPLEPYRYPQV